MPRLIALLSDTHFGVRNDASQFHSAFAKFFAEVFFPKLEALGIKDVIHGGDVFDKRQTVDFATLQRSREYFFDPLRDAGISMDVVIGNHDTYFKSTNDVNSPTLLLKEYKNIHVFSNPTESVRFPGITYIPWITRENAQRTLELIQKTSSKTAIGHLELAGFRMYKNSNISHGLDPKHFSKFERVYTGHYHHRSSTGNIHYVGATAEHTWSDFDDWRGFHILDADTYEIVESVRNPFTIFNKIIIDDPKQIEMPSEEDLEGKFFQVEIKTEIDPKKIDSLRKVLNELGASQVDINDRTVLKSLEEVKVSDVSDTRVLIDKYIQANIDDVEKQKRVAARLGAWYERAIQES